MKLSKSKTALLLATWLSLVMQVDANDASHLRPLDNLVESTMIHEPRLTRGLAIFNPVPTKGDQPLLVVLADFPDLQGLFTGSAWDTRFFAGSTASFADYFHEVSYGQLRYTGAVVGMDSSGSVVENSGSVAYVRLPNSVTFYADGNRGFNMGSVNFPKNSGGAVYHALQALDDAGFDFEPFVEPETNRVENVVVVYAGSTARYTGDLENSLEATAYRLGWAGLNRPFITTGGYEIDNYTVCPDQQGNLSGDISFIGICVHEQGHALGMADLYDLTLTNAGAGVFDLMAYGTNGASYTGENPFHPGAFSKVIFDWVKPTVLTSGFHEISLQPSQLEPDIVKIFPNGDESATEYFLLENRQLIGYDRFWVDSLPNLCPGLLIWHIDDAIVSDRTLFFLINTHVSNPSAPPHPGARVIEADGRNDLTTPNGSNYPSRYFGECADTWKVGQIWEDGVLWQDGASTAISVEVVGKVGVDLQLLVSVGGGLPPPTDLPPTPGPPTDSPMATPPATSPPTDSPMAAPLATSPPTGTPTEDPQCFSGRTTVSVQGQGSRRMDQLRIGDSVLADDIGTYVKVHSFGHRSETTEAEFIQIGTDAGVLLEITANHMLYVFKETTKTGILLPAGEVRVGDMLVSQRGLAALATVHSVGTVYRSGIYAPFTANGKIAVGGVIASNYVALPCAFHGVLTYQQQHWMQHVIFTPYRLYCGFVGCNDETYGEFGFSRAVEVWLPVLHWLEGRRLTGPLIFVGDSGHWMDLNNMAAYLVAIAMVSTLVLWKKD